MSNDNALVDKDMIDKTLAVNPDEDDAADHLRHPGQDAGQDESIARRLERNPASSDARLDTALDESMDASDPPSSTQPVHNQDAPASSGYDADEEARLRDGKRD